MTRKNQLWYELQVDNDIIIEKDVAPNVNVHLHITDSFTKLGWNPILQLPLCIYPDLVREFNANIQDTGDHGNSYLELTVRGRSI